MIFIKVFQKIIPALFTLCWFSLSSKKSLLLLLVVSFLIFTCDEEKPVPTTGTITGKVTDRETGEPLSKVAVNLRSQGTTTNTIATKNTQNDGNYDFQDVAAGSYTLSFSGSGYEPGVTKEVTVEGGGTGNGDIALNPAQATLAIKNDNNRDIDTLDFGTESSSQVFTISNDGDDGSILTFEVIKTEKWLTLDPSPAGGSITKNAAGVPKPITVTVDRDMIEFNEQMVTTNIIITANGSVKHKTIIVKVRQKINLDITPQKIVFNCEDAKNSIITKTFTLENLSNDDLTYTIIERPDWISVDPEELTGEVRSQRVEIDMIVNTVESKEDEKGLIKIRYRESNRSPITLERSITYIAPKVSIMTGNARVNSTDRTRATIVSTITVMCHDISRYGHVWSTTDPPDPDNSEPSLKKEIASLSQNGMFTSELTGLLPKTVYYVMAYVRGHDENLIEKGSVKSFNTSNTPPTEFVLNFPNNNAKNIILSPTLRWQASTDPDGDNITYDVYLGTTSNTTDKVSTEQIQTNYTVSSVLEEGTDYYWRVVVKDGQGNMTESKERLFTTINPTAMISLSPSSIDFGSVNVGGESSPQTLTITNTGDKSFDVTNITSSLSEFNISDNSSGRIDAGVSHPVFITFRPTSARTYDGTITVNNDADNGKNTINVSGTGVDNSMSVISLSPSSLNFGSVNVGGSSPQTLTIRNDGNKSFNVTGINLSSSAFSGNYSGTIDAGRSRTVEITFRPTSERTYNETITVLNNADNGNNTISVSGRGVDNSISTISLSPSSIDFGSVDVDSRSSPRTLTIRNTGDKSFDVTNITSSSSRFSVSSNSLRTIDAGRSRTVEITFRPTSERTYNETITVLNNADNGNNTISVSGTGRSAGAPNLVFVEYEIDDDNSSGSSGDDDGVAETGETIELDVRLRNSGDATATNVDATLSTTDRGINITDDDVTFGDISSGSNDTGSDFDFEIASGGSSRNVTFTLRITSDEGSWTTTFSIFIQAPAPSRRITPANTCNTAPTLDIDTEYYIEINLGSYGRAAPIQGHSSGGDIRGFWFKVNAPSSGAIVKIYEVDGFDPVIGFKQFLCPSFLNDYLDLTIGSRTLKYLDVGGRGQDESITLISSGMYNMRIYDYFNTSSTIRFKIIVESR